MRSHLKEEALGLDKFLSDLQNCVSFQNGGHRDLYVILCFLAIVNFADFVFSVPLDMSQSTSHFSVLWKYTDSSGSPEFIMKIVFNT